MLKKALLASAAAVAALVAALLIVVLTFDLNDYRHDVETQASTALGLAVQVNGDMSFTFGLPPKISIRGIRIANPEWASRSHLAEAERVAVQIALIPLITGKIKINEIELQGADIMLEQSSDGKGNWNFETDTTRGKSEGHSLEIGKISLAEVGLAYRKSPDIVYSLKISEAIVKAGFDGPSEGQAQSAYNDQAFLLSFTGSQLPETSRNIQPWPFEAELKLADAALGIRGQFSKPFQTDGLKLQAVLRGKHLQTLRPLINISLPETGAYELSAKLAATNAAFMVSDIKVSASDPEGQHQLLIGKGHIEMGKDKPTQASIEGMFDAVPIDLSFSGPDLKRLLADETSWPIAMQASASAVNTSLSGTVTKNKLGITTELDIALDGQQIGSLQPLLGKLALRLKPIELKTHVKYSNKTVSFEDVSGQFGNTDLAGKMTLQLAGTRPRLTAELVSKRTNVEDFTTSESKPEPNESNDGVLHKPLALDWLREFDADLAVTIKRLEDAPVPMRDIHVRGQLEGGKLALKNVRAVLAQIPMWSSLSLDTKGEIPAFAGQIKATRIAPADTLKSIGLPEYLGGDLADVSLEFATKGNTIGALIEQTALKLTTGSSRIVFPTESGEQPIEFLLTTVTVAGDRSRAVEVSLDGAFHDVPFKLSLVGGKLHQLVQQKGFWRSMAIKLRSQLRELPLQITGRVTSTQSLLSGRDIALDMKATLSDIRSEVIGKISDVRDWSETKLTLRARGSNTTLARLAGATTNGHSGPFQATARFRVSKDSLESEEFSIMSAGSDLSGSFKLLLRERLKIIATLQSHWLNLSDFTGSGEKSPVHQANQAAADSAQRVQVFTSDPLPLNALQRLDAEIELEAQRLTLGDLDTRGAKLVLTLNNGQLDSDIELADGRALAKVGLKPNNQAPIGSIKLHTTQLKQGMLTGEQDPAKLEDQVAVDTDISLTGSGDSLRALMRHANGSITISSGEGRFKRIPGLGLLSGGIIYELLGTVNPFVKKDEYAYLSCAAIHLDVKDGIATSTKGIAIQTENRNIIGSGAANFDSEEIDLGFQTKTRKALRISLGDITAKFVKVSGTFSEPTVELSTKKAIFQSSAVWATGGISLLAEGLWERITPEKNPCTKVLEKKD